MLEPRLYRVMLAPALIAVIVGMFAVVSRPEALRSEVAPETFDGARAARLARQLVEVAPERTPGSVDDEAAADYVTGQFEQIGGGQVAEQSFTATFDGEEEDLRNVSLLLPGETSERIVIAAARDCAEGTCAASSAAATAALVELAAAFGETQHRRTLVFVSLDGSAAGAAGARELAAVLRETPADGVIVISQPGTESPKPPFVLAGSAGPRSASVQLTESAEEAVETELGVDAELARSPLSALLRLAVPAGLGDQATLISEDVQAVGFSSAGDLPLDPDADSVADLSPATLGQVGRAALTLALALDARTEALEDGPESYVPLAGKLIPGWSLALLALALLLPVGAVAADGLIRSQRAGEPALETTAWVASRGIPFLGGLVLVYAMALVGILPAPDFPYQPQANSPEAGGLIAVGLTIAALAAGLAAIRLVDGPRDLRDSLGPAVGLVLFVAALALWLVNPFSALLIVPTVHLWLLASAPLGSRGLTVAALLAGLVPLAAALAIVGSQLSVWLQAPWHLLLLFSGGHFGLQTAIPLCLIAGCFVAIISGVPRRGPEPA